MRQKKNMTTSTIRQQRIPHTRSLQKRRYEGYSTRKYHDVVTQSGTLKIQLRNGYRN